jgi:hypothetical protein
LLFCKAEEYCTVYIYWVFFLHPSTDGHFDSLSWLLWIMQWTQECRRLFKILISCSSN